MKIETSIHQFDLKDSSKLNSMAIHIASQMISQSLYSNNEETPAVVIYGPTIRLKLMIEEQFKLLGAKYHEGLWAGEFDGRRWSAIVETRP